MSDSMEFVVTDEGVLKEYNGSDEVMVIPDGVKTIGTDILGWRKGEQVRKVIVPEGVTEIKKAC